MKFFLTSLLLTTSAIASTVDSHSLPILGTESQDHFSLATTVTRTIYRQDTIERTCYRSIIIGYNHVCDTWDLQAPPRRPGDNHGQTPSPGANSGHAHPGPSPRPEPHPYPGPRPPRVTCHEQPIYRTEAYSCAETVSVPVEVTDHQNVSNFDVKVAGQANANLGAQCSLNFTLSGDNLSTGTNCNDYLVTANSSKVTNIDRNGTQVNDYKYAVSLANMADVTAPLAGGLTNLHLEDQTLNVVTGDLNRGKVTLKLFVQRRRFLRDDETLIDRVLAPTEYSYVSTGGATGITKIDLAKLIGGINASKKHIVKVQLDVAIPAGQVLNSTVPATHQESQITIWNN